MKWVLIRVLALSFVLVTALSYRAHAATAPALTAVDIIGQQIAYLKGVTRDLGSLDQRTVAAELLGLIITGSFRGVFKGFQAASPTTDVLIKEGLSQTIPYFQNGVNFRQFLDWALDNTPNDPVALANLEQIVAAYVELYPSVMSAPFVPLPPVVAIPVPPTVTAPPSVPCVVFPTASLPIGRGGGRHMRRGHGHGGGGRVQHRAKRDAAREEIIAPLRTIARTQGGLCWTNFQTAEASFWAQVATWRAQRHR